MNYEIPAFTREEGRSYILEKLQGAGAAKAIFEDAALEAVLNASDGTSRVINNLCNSCLLIGDSRKSDMITAEIIMQAICRSPTCNIKIRCIQFAGQQFLCSVVHVGEEWWKH